MRITDEEIKQDDLDYIGNDGSAGRTHTTISEAIDILERGDTIRAYPVADSTETTNHTNQFPVKMGPSDLRDLFVSGVQAETGD